jgi:DNA invertase Pin-like site-specific DNA recombinase
MLSVLAEITSRGAAYKSLAKPWADTTHELGEVLAALVGCIARKTREDILRRTAAGRERARLRGVKFGAAQALAGATKLGASPTPIRKSIAACFKVSSTMISRLKPKASRNAS